MRAREFITEQNLGSMQDDVARALPATYAIPALQNQDPYKQYRFGVAIAGAKGRKSETNAPHMDKSSPWGENQIVVSFANTIDEYIDDALHAMGLSSSAKKLISTPKSEEGQTVNKNSPVAQWNKTK